MPERLQCTPEVNSYRIHCAVPHRNAPRLGTYRGFGLRGEPDGRGQWTGDSGAAYCGEWRGGLQHGQGIETAEGGWVYRGDFFMGKLHGKAAVLDPRGKLVAEVMWQHGRVVSQYGLLKRRLL
jgi:hypothetical protein